jgi:hypothetical protein
MGVAEARDNHLLATRDAPRPKTVAGAQWHRQSLRLNVTIISYAHSQGHDHRKLGSRQDEPPWPGVHNHLAVYPNLGLNPLMRITSPATSRQDSVQPLEPILSPRHSLTTPTQTSRLLPKSGSVPAPPPLPLLLYPTSLTRPVLSSAFFRGADAVIHVFDVNQPTRDAARS